MTQRLLITTSLCLALCISVACADSIKFEDYRRLSQEERQKAAHDASPEMQKQYGRWDQILSMGGKSWNDQQARALVSSKGLSELGGIFATQMNVRGWYHLQKVTAYEKKGMSKEQAVKAVEASPDIPSIRNEEYLDSWSDLVKLAPTPEALALNEKAKALVAEWYARFDGKNITIKDLMEVDTAAREIRDQMRKLPQWTPEQIETALAGLP